MSTTAIRWGRALLWLVYAWAIVTLVLLFLAFILLLFGANPDAGFVEWVYRSTERAMAPFRGIFEPVQLTDTSVLDTSVLFAMIVYGFVAMGLNVAVDWTTRKLRESQSRDQDAALAAPGDLATQATALESSRLVNLTGPGGASASATLTPDTNGTSIELTVWALPPAQNYGVWIETTDGRRVAVGSFQPGHDGSVKLSLTSPALLGDVRMFGVTPLSSTGAASSADVLATRVG